MNEAIRDLWATYEFLPIKDYPWLSADRPKVAHHFYDWIKHHTWDDYWKRWSIRTRYTQVQVPALNFSGWYDVFMNAAESYPKGHISSLALKLGRWPGTAHPPLPPQDAGEGRGGGKVPCNCSPHPNLPPQAGEGAAHSSKSGPLGGQDQRNATARHAHAKRAAARQPFPVALFDYQRL